MMNANSHFGKSMYPLIMYTILFARVSLGRLQMGGICPPIVQRDKALMGDS